jgi:hypothetical protein
MCSAHRAPRALHITYRHTTREIPKPASLPLFHILFSFVLEYANNYDYVRVLALLHKVQCGMNAARKVVEIVLFARVENPPYNLSFRPSPEDIEFFIDRDICDVTFYHFILF